MGLGINAVLFRANTGKVLKINNTERFDTGYEILKKKADLVNEWNSQNIVLNTGMVILSGNIKTKNFMGYCNDGKAGLWYESNLKLKPSIHEKPLLDLVPLYNDLNNNVIYGECIEDGKLIVRVGPYKSDTFIMRAAVSLCNVIVVKDI